MSTLVHPRSRHAAPKRAELRPLPAAGLDAPATPITAAASRRWMLVLVIPFVVGFAFFGLAMALDTEWPMVPAFLLGALPLICAYIYLALSSDSNSE